MSPKVPGSKAILMTEDWKILLLYRTADAPTAPSTWTCPGGHLEINEDPYQGICRELAEEIGHIPLPLEKIDVYENRLVRVHIYHAMLDTNLDGLILGTEEQQMGLYTLQDAYKLPIDDINEHCLRLTTRIL